MTRFSVLPLTFDRIDDLVRVYNEHRHRRSEFIPLTPQDIKTMIRKEILNLGQVLLMLDGPIPIASASWGLSHNQKWAYVSNLGSIQGSWDSVSDLVDYILTLARGSKVETVRIWVPSTNMKLTEILAELTFEIRRVRFPLRNSLPMTEPCQKSQTVVVKRWKGGSNPPVHTPGHSAFRPLELHELRDHYELAWEPRYFMEDESGAVTAIGFRSKTERGQGWIGLREDINTRHVSEPLTIDAIQGILASLQSDGVRSVSTEIDAARKLKNPFLDAGFESLLTLYELELDLAYL